MRKKLTKKEERTARLCALRRKAEKMSIDRLVEVTGLSRDTVTRFRSGGSVRPETEKALALALNVRRKEALYVEGRDFCADPCAALDAGDVSAYTGLGVEAVKLKAPKRVSIAGMPLWCDEHWRAD